MKVLKSGDGRKGWSCEATCSGKGNGGGGCGAKLLVEQGDLFRTASSCMGEVERFVTFKCVECGVKTDLADGKKPPRDIEDKLPGDPDRAALQDRGDK